MELTLSPASGEGPWSAGAPELDRAYFANSALKALRVLLGLNAPLVCKLPSRRAAIFGPQPAGRGTPCCSAFFSDTTQELASVAVSAPPSKISHLKARQI